MRTTPVLLEVKDLYLKYSRLGKIEFLQISQHQGIVCCIVRNYTWKKINTWARVRLGHGNARPSILGHGARSEPSPKNGSTVLRYIMTTNYVVYFLSYEFAFRRNELQGYLDLLVRNFNQNTVEDLMCRNLIR